MKELLNEWKKFLLEQTGNTETTIDEETGDVTLSDDAYAASVLMLFRSFAGHKVNYKWVASSNEIKRKKRNIFYYSQFESAAKEAEELHKIFFNILKLITDKKIRKKIIDPYDFSTKSNTIRNIIHKRSMAEDNKTLQDLTLNYHYVLIWKLFSITSSLDAARTISDYKKDPQKVKDTLKDMDQQLVGTADFLNKLKSYKKLLEMEDPELRKMYMKFFINGVLHDPYSFTQLESFMGIDM